MFDFATTSRIIFGEGKIQELRSILPSGKKVFLITGEKYPDKEIVLEQIPFPDEDIIHYSLCKEPTIAIIDEGKQKLKNSGCEVVISYGGGSVLDTGKAIAAMSTNPGNTLDYLEVIGTGHKLINKPLYHIAIPTTAGTGTEVTRNAVITSTEKKVKVSLRHTWLLPDVAIIDPALTRSLPPAGTANSGMDALSQLIEPFVSIRANSFTDMFCVEGIKRIQRSLPVAYINGLDMNARTDMSFASLLGGLSLANAGLGAVHGLAGPIGGMFEAPHGAICARLLPFVIEKNISALQIRNPQSQMLHRFDSVFELMQIRETKLTDRINKLLQLTAALGINPLGNYGLEKQHAAELVDMAIQSSSMKANPILLTPEEVTEILTNAL